MPMNPRLLVPRANLDPDAAAYIRAVEIADAQALEAGVKRAIDRFVRGCKQDGIWSAMKTGCILMGARTLAGALVPFVGGAPTNVSNNFVSGDYNRKTGLAGNGTNKSLDSNRNNNADPQDNKSFSVYISNAGADGGVVRAVIYSGFNGTAGAAGFGFRASDGASNFNNHNATADAPTIANPVGLVGASRSSSANYVARFAGSNTTYTRTSETPNNANITLYETGGARFSGVRLAFYHIGESLNLANLDTRVTALVNGISAAVVPQVSNADAQDWLNRVYDNGGTVSTATANAVNTFCNDIDAAGIRDRFYRLNLFCGTSDGSIVAPRVPLYRGPSRTGTQYGNAIDTNNNFVQGDYAETGASGGITSDSSSKRLRTGFKLNELPDSVTDNHIGAFVFAHTPTLSNHWMIGSRESTGTIGFMRTTNTNGGTWVVNNGSATSHQYGGQHPAALYLASRRTATALEIYENSTSRNTNASTSSTSPFDGENFVFDVNNQGNPTGGFTFRLGGYAFGLGMTTAQVTSLANAWAAFNTALSRT